MSTGSMRQDLDQDTPLYALKHKDKRTNIPTEELRDFVADDEKQPKVILYPRDPSLDPQLVWRGKDDQDQNPLEVPAVPIYIQEKIHPQAIIEDLRTQALKDKTSNQLSLFSDFNGITFENLIDFYHHEQNWTNRMILGDSLLVMTSLAVKEGLRGKVQMIYIDPPYGIKFGSNWQVSTRKRDVRDGRVEDLTRQPEQIRAFRDTWKMGIHSYLTYLRDRMVVAQDLLSETGSIFVQIGDENVHLVRCLLDEVFGSKNFISQISFATTTGFVANTLSRAGDYLLWYAKNAEQVKYRQLYTGKSFGSSGSKGYDFVELPDGSSRRVTSDEVAGTVSLPPDAKVFSLGDLQSQNPSQEDQAFFYQGQVYRPNSNNHWKAHYPDGMSRLACAGRIAVTGHTPRYKRYFHDFPVFPFHNLWSEQLSEQSKEYVVQTSTKVIERCLLMTTDPGDLVLDPTCGSGTTAHVAEQWGRRWITIDTSRVALALVRTRLMTARFPYYLLSDSPDGLLKEAEVTGYSLSLSAQNTERDIKKGFVYKRVPHITLKSIANNPEIDAIYSRWEEKLEPIRQALNLLQQQTWEGWQIPRKGDRAWSKEAQDLLKEWWRLYDGRQREIGNSIMRRADAELLYDQPLEDPRRIRVVGSFTVESLSPYRVISTEEERPASEVEGQRQSPGGQFETMIIDNLKKAGVQNTNKDERLKFDRLESYAGVWLHAEGEYTEKDGGVRRVAVCIGPEHGTVGPDLVKEAAKEAVQGIGFDLLIVCGFAFDPHVSQEVKRYGKLTILPAHMNPDLLMGDDLLKKTNTGNLFMVFGEPDIELNTQEDGEIVLEIRGVDVYDPTTAQIRSNSVDDIACWLIDTDYNGESFFVRHAYFTGADEPYDKLKRALRSEIDEAIWSTLYSTKSRPFAMPKTGKIAVKVINYYGDEVLKVYNVCE